MVETIGYIGLNHSHRSLYLESLAQLPVEITCACEPDKSFDLDRIDNLNLDRISLYRDPDALLGEEDIDLAWVTLSNKATAPVVETAVKRGIDVFAEKSLARTATELAPVAEAAQRADATVGTAYFNRASPVHRELRYRRSSGFFGDLRAFGANLFTNKLTSRLQSAQQPDYLYNLEEAGGGILQWLGCHYLDLFEWILNDPVERMNAQLTYGDTATDIEDGATVQMETCSGAQGTLQLGYYLRAASGLRGDAAAGPDIEPMHIYGMDGSAVVASDGATVRLGADVPEWDSAPTRTLLFEEPATPGYGGQAGLDYINALFEVCRGNDNELVATIGDELRVLQLLDAAYESAKTNEWVEPELH
ncbi:Gfo/Idh/MocA family protein [Saliphagus sp. LR7]|uniref:Gfo/Idh/MocA family protein n=1 Tax=Saliphagus sp. LR7 TaxID=2282654 RepID=UPI000DF7D9DD|nr:Gfo/Idh/MocA family oxidoreductase [Saliphagus sp. LR7]